MRSTFKVLFYLKKSRLTADGYPVMCRITVNGTQTAFSCKMTVPAECWDMAANRPKKSKSPRIIEINDYLDDIENRLKKHYRLLCEKTDYVTAQRVKDAYHGFGDDNKTLLEAYDYRLQQVQQDIGIGHKQSTYDKLSNERRCLESFLKDKYREDMLLKELDSEFIETYYQWMLGVRSYHATTAFGRIQSLKCVLYIAVAKHWVSHHPFLEFHCRPAPAERTRLTDDEICRLMALDLRYHRQRPSGICLSFAASPAWLMPIFVICVIGILSSMKRVYPVSMPSGKNRYGVPDTAVADSVTAYRAIPGLSG